jgi:hypothetical protein
MALVVLALCACLGWGGGARAAATVEVLETFPRGENVVLAKNQNYYLRLRYRTDAPVRIWARPYFRGRTVDAGSNPSPRYEGSGEALGWFFLMQPGTRVDEIRVTAGDGGVRTTPRVASLRVHVTGGSGVAHAPEPAWVARLRAQADEAARLQQVPSGAGPGAGGTLLLGGFMLAMLAIGLLGFAAPAWGLWRSRGGWRMAAAVPAAVMAFVVLRIMVGAAVDPTSHNLWPFEVLQAGVLALAAMLGLWIARRFSGAWR